MIPCESLAEFQVNEINFDGSERIEKPLTPTENFQRIVNRIDFTEKDDELREERSQEQRQDIPSCVWLPVKDQIIAAHSEICALTDILAVAVERKYIGLNQINIEERPSNYPLLLAGKKMALASAAQIITRGADRMRAHHASLAGLSSSSAGGDSRAASFHEILKELRKSWRLKIYQNSVLGDVGLKSTGSKSKESGTFELREQEHSKHDMSVDIIFNSTLATAVEKAAFPGSLLVEFLTTDPDCTADGPTLLWQTVFEPQINSHENKTGNSVEFKDLTLHKKLLMAQRVLACREILSILAMEASCSRFPGISSSELIAFATQDQVIASLFPGVQICIRMLKRHKDPPAKYEVPAYEESALKRLPRIMQVKETALTGNLYSKATPAGFKRSANMESLALTLRRILHHQHCNAWSNISSIPNPVTPAIQVSTRLREAGAQGFSADRLLQRHGEITPVHQSSSLMIGTAAVSGFASVASTTWMASKRGLTVAPTSSVPTASGQSGSGLLSGVAQVPTLSQDRHALFTEWGEGARDDQAGATPSAGREQASNVASFEHSMMRAGAGKSALEVTVGASCSMLNKCVRVCRHFYLRQKTMEALDQFAARTPFCINVSWNGLNSAVQSTAQVHMFYSEYATYKYRASLTVDTTSITLYYTSPPRCTTISLDQLDTVLNEQLMQVQLNFLEIVAVQLLGWTCLSYSSYAGRCPDSELAKVGGPLGASLEEDRDETFLRAEHELSPFAVKLIASPSARYLVCLRVCNRGLVRCFVADLTQTLAGKTDYNVFVQQNLEEFGNVLKEQFELERPAHQAAKTDEPRPLSSLDLISDCLSAKENSLPADSPHNRGRCRFREIDLSRMVGFNVLEKVEAVLSALETRSDLL